MQPSGIYRIRFAGHPRHREWSLLANGLERKHAVKQVDRLLTNTKLNVWSLFDDWVPYVVSERTGSWYPWTDRIRCR